VAFPVLGTLFTGATAYLLKRRLGSLFAVVMAMMGAWMIKLLVLLLIKFFLIYILLFTNFGVGLVEDVAQWFFESIMSIIDGINLDIPRPERPVGIFNTNSMRLLAVLRMDDIGLLILYFLLMWVVIKIFIKLLRLVFLGKA